MPGGFTRGLEDSLGDIPDNVLSTVRAMAEAGFIDPDEADYGSLPELNSEHIDAVRDGDQHVNHQGLIDMAHQDGLCLTYTEPIQMPGEKDQKPLKEEDENGRSRKVADSMPAVFRAVVVTRRGVFMAHGDAKQEDTMVDAIHRMAETRALNRALRQAVNIGQATAEEMPGSGGGASVEVE